MTNKCNDTLNAISHCASPPYLGALPMITTIRNQREAFMGDWDGCLRRQLWGNKGPLWMQDETFCPPWDFSKWRDCLERKSNWYRSAGHLLGAMLSWLGSRGYFSRTLCVSCLSSSFLLSAVTSWWLSWAGTLSALQGLPETKNDADIMQGHSNLWTSLQVG